MTPDPFYRRSGFWTALSGTVPLIFAIFRHLSGGEPISQEEVIFTIGVWGTWFASTKVRPSISIRRASGGRDGITTYHR